MPRPPLDVGTFGKIRLVPTATGVRARTLYRGYDGVTRPLERTGPTERAAEAKLKRAIRDLAKSLSVDIKPDSKVVDVATIWFEHMEEFGRRGKRAPGTIDNYRSVLKNHVIPALGDLRLREVRVSRIDRFLSSVHEKTSSAHARTARAVISGVLQYAVRNDALDTNPVRDAASISGNRKKPRALTKDERSAWLEQLRGDQNAVAKDLPDLTAFMMATGVRIGECLGVYWDDVRWEQSAVSVAHTVVRVRGEGLVRKSPKTDAGVRVLPLASWVMAMLVRRWDIAQDLGQPLHSPIFPDALGGLRDASNTRRDLRDARGTEGFAWVTSHVFRKTAATILDEAGHSARQIADHMGHTKPSMTQDVYMGREAVPESHARSFEGLFSGAYTGFYGDKMGIEPDTNSSATS